jgi:hypothetical protein
MSEISFSSNQEREADFLAWLTEGHVISEPRTQSGVKGGFRVVSIEGIKQLITDAFEKHDDKQINNLLALAAQSQPLSNDLIRKSMRVGSGEYLKLWYVKLLEKTSFSDVIVRMLVPIAKDYLSTYMKNYQQEIGEENNRLKHLFKLLEKWPNISPESRERAVDMRLSDFELDKELLPDSPRNLEKIKDSVSRVILNELENQLFPRPFDHKNRVFEEFKQEWANQLSENPLYSMTLEASIDEVNSNRVIFTPNVVLSKTLTEDDQERLFEKYGEMDVVDFINKFNPKDTDKGEKRYLGSAEELHEKIIYLQIYLPSCSANVLDSDNFEANDITSDDTMKKINQDAINLRVLIGDLGKRVDINTDNFFVNEHKYLRDLPSDEDSEIPLVFARSETLTNFLKIATQLAKETKDFVYIAEINSCRNRILDYVRTQSFVSNLVESSVRRRSVVSFYVNEDVWRFLPLAIKGKNWIKIADAYLTSKLK